MKHINLFIFFTIICISAYIKLQAQTPILLWQDNFDSDPVNIFPQGWTPSGNGSTSYVTNSNSYSPPNSLLMEGISGADWEALMHRAYDNSLMHYQFEFTYLFTGEGAVGIHPYYGGVGLYSGTDWTATYKRILIYFALDYKIRTQSGVTLGSYSINTWVKVKIDYLNTESNLVLTYYVSDVLIYTETVGLSAGERNLQYLTIFSGDTKCLFDDVNVYAFANYPTITNPKNISGCIGDSASFNVSATGQNLSYQWQKFEAGSWKTLAGDTTNELSFSNVQLSDTGSYRCAVVNENGGATSSAATLRLNPLPPANAGHDYSVCEGSLAILGAVAITSDIYSWTSNPPGFTSQISDPVVIPTVTTTYTLTQVNTATGCKDSNSVIITVNPLPAAYAFDGTDTSVCSGASLSLGTTANSGSTYSWKSSNTGFTDLTSDPVITPTITSMYTLTEKDTATGCQNSNSVVIFVNPLPAAKAGVDTTVCAGTLVALGAAANNGNSYLWESSPSGFTNLSSDPVVKPTITTTYILSETINSTGCRNADSVIVSVKPMPNVNAGSNQTICSGDTATLTSGMYDSYLWNTGQTAQSIKVHPTDTSLYKVTVSLNGCTDSGSVKVNVNPVPDVKINPSNPSPICAGKTIHLTASGADTYQWSPSVWLSNISGDTVTVKPISTQVYTITGTLNGCLKIQYVTVSINYPPAIYLGNDTTLCPGKSIVLNAGNKNNSYLWNDNSTDNEQAVAISGIYSVTVTDNSGCTNSDSIKINYYPKILIYILGRIQQFQKEK